MNSARRLDTNMHHPIMQAQPSSGRLRSAKREGVIGFGLARVEGFPYNSGRFVRVSLRHLALNLTGTEKPLVQEQGE